MPMSRKKDILNNNLGGDQIVYLNDEQKQVEKDTI